VVEIFVYLHDRSDRLALQVPASLRVGPDLPPSLSSLQQEFSQWTPAWTASLKATIAQVACLEASRLQLFHHGVRLTNDRRRLRDCGIRHGHEICVRTSRDPAKPFPEREGKLATQALRQEKHEQRQHLERYHAALAKSAGASRPSTAGSRTRPSTAGSGARLMPKWQPSSQLKWFGTPGGEWFGTRGGDFGNYGTWHPSNEDTNDGLSRLRTGTLFTAPVQYVPDVA